MFQRNSSPLSPYGRSRGRVTAEPYRVANTPQAGRASCARGRDARPNMEGRVSKPNRRTAQLRSPVFLMAYRVREELLPPRLAADDRWCRRDPSDRLEVLAERVPATAVIRDLVMRLGRGEEGK
ncbi:hypothetical protein GCM10010267_06410 [Streptomyces griseorubens]|nr:hypothetical protein GCM10010267_06410 [Streptomyces griseorubens]